jgi:DNA-binding NarL/FixJ family response regulator
MIHIACFRDAHFFSDALIKLIDDKRNFKIDIISYSASDLLYKIRHQHIDLVMMLQDDDTDSIKQLVNCITKAYSYIPIAYIQPGNDVQKAKEIEKTGVHVYLYRMSALNLIDSLHGVVHGHGNTLRHTSIFIPEPDFKLSSGSSSRLFLLLSKQQKKIICDLSKGMERHQIATRNNLSIHTINKYIQIAKEKCGCLDTKELLEICANDIKLELHNIENSIPEIRVKKNANENIKIATA